MDREPEDLETLALNMEEGAMTQGIQWTLETGKTKKKQALH